jgi:DNA-binding response OmpR family regulator
MKLLIVEDNARLAERIDQRLKKTYNIDVAGTGQDAVKQAGRIEYGVIVLDIGLPDISGYEVCKTLRENNIQTPILILTGEDNMETRVKLLESGADDYVTKPFDIDELKARIGALGRRRSRQPLNPIIKYGDLVIDTNQRKVHRNGTLLALRRKEFDILEYLVSNSGRVLTREMIMNHAWDANKVSWTSTVDVHIKHLRDKVDKPFATQIIKTAYGLGYRVDRLES